MIRRHHQKGITFIVATAILLAAAGVLALTQSQPAPAQDLKAIKADYRRPAALPVENKALANLGRDLFFDTRISASGRTSCASCHLPELGYVVTEAHPINDSGKPTSRKSQPLIGLGHAGKALIGWDGRSATLEAQTKSSIATGSMSMRETSSPVKVEIIEERVKSDSGYAAKFNAALPGRPIDVDAIAAALAAFERTLEPAITPFDRWIAVTRRRSAPPPNAALHCSTARPPASPATTAGGSPTTSFTTSAPRRPTRAAARRSRTRP